MKLHLGKYGSVAAVALLAASCSSVPGHVIPPKEMASLLADIHIGESVVDLNRNDFRTDSSKAVMLQSVLAHHGVTKQQLDTSFDWYGHNISYYMEVYDKTIEILEKKLAETGNRIAAENISIAGDSVDVWNSAVFLAVNKFSPSQHINFALSRDENWENGDSYTWRAKLTNSSDNSFWAIVADYADGSKEMISGEFSGDGWRELKFISDSTKRTSRVYGYIDAVPRGNTTIWIDSIMLIRNRLDPENYHQHFRQQRLIPKNLIKEEKLDTAVSTENEGI